MNKDHVSLSSSLLLWSSHLMWGFTLIPACIFISAFYLYQPEGMYWSYAWAPSLNVYLDARVDGLSFLFLLLITGVGTLIQIYAMAYMKKVGNRLSFHLYLTLFMFAMLGLVLSDNILLMFVFWELTTFTSYLLIGFEHEKAEARKNALHSLLVTGAGGLALLAGLILLGEMVGSYQFRFIIEHAAALPEHPLFTASLILVLLGALTKSAQFPFHFWLPGAMAAPTPVSAYLHSATMVKAGIYLLARLSPVYNESALWCNSLIIVGGVTALWSALIAVKQTDLKLILAYSTNCALGKLTLLLGIGSELAITAAVLFIMAHALYKAALFMVIGNIYKAKGTRDINLLHGLSSIMTFSFIAAVIAALSKAGLPPLFGFLSKEYMYKAGLEMTVAVAILLLFVNSIMVALAIQVVYRPFLSRKNKNVTNQRLDYEPGLWLPPLLLATSSFVIPIFMLDWLNENIISPAISSIKPHSVVEIVKIWQGINTPLFLSGLTLLLGYFIFRSINNDKIWKALHSISTPDASMVFQNMLNNMLTVASWQTGILQHKRLSLYILVFFTVLLLMLTSVPLSLPSLSLQLFSMLSFHEVGLAILMVISALSCAISRSRLVSVASLCAIGFLSTLVFSLYSAPDVAKTLLLVETLMVVFVVLLMGYFPPIKRSLSHSTIRKGGNLVIAVGIGGVVTMTMIHIIQQPIDMAVPSFYAEQSLAAGYGRNVVNVILVDLRAFDTLGEILVVVVAGISSVALITHMDKKAPLPNSIIFRSTAHIVAPLMMLFSIYLLLRGHNAPGGGFIGALIAVSGLALLIFAESPQFVRQRIYFQPFNIAIGGVLLGVLAGITAMIVGMPFLTALWWNGDTPVGSPLLFDLGVYLAIVGGVTGMLLHIKERLH